MGRKGAPDMNGGISGEADAKLGRLTAGGAPDSGGECTDPFVSVGGQAKGVETMPVGGQQGEGTGDNVRFVRVSTWH
jgi:hypothetical protein